MKDIRQSVIGKILGDKPKVDFYTKNSRTKKRPRKSDSCVDTSDRDADQGLATESEREN